MLQLRARVDLGAMAMKVYSTFPKAPALLEPHHEIDVSLTVFLSIDRSIDRKIDLSVLVEQFFYLSIYLSITLFISIYLSIYLSKSIHIYLSIYLFPFDCFPIYSIYQYTHIYVSSFVFLYFSLFIIISPFFVFLCLSVCLSVCVRQLTGDLGSIPGRVISKTQKMVLDASLLNTQHYKVRIKG